MTPRSIGWWVAPLVIALVIAGCSSVVPAPGASPSGSNPSSSPTPATDPTAIPTAVSAPPSPSAVPSVAPPELEVACAATATVIATPAVRALADGVHIHFTNTSGGPVQFSIGDSTGLALLGDEVPAAGRTDVETLAPGGYRLTCGGSPVAFLIVDPDALHAPTARRCASEASGSIDHGSGAKGVSGSPVDIARTMIKGLRPGDLVEPGGYPEARGARLVRVIRGGDVIAVLVFESLATGRWLITATHLCSGTGLGI